MPAGHDYMTDDPNGGDQMGESALESFFHIVLFPIYLIFKVLGLVD